MKKLKRQVFGTSLALLCLNPGIAHAQLNDGLQDQGFGDLNLQTSVTFSIPLGATDHRRLADKPRFGIGLSLARDDFNSPIGRLGTERLNLLDLGTYAFKTPSLEFSGQEIYQPTFAILHADENTETEEKSPESKERNSSLLLVGAGVTIVTLGSLVLVTEAADDFSDCFLVFTDVPDKCRD
jgi:hypothetical protein